MKAHERRARKLIRSTIRYLQQQSRGEEAYDEGWLDALKTVRDVLLNNSYLISLPTKRRRRN